jgi:hypothetical protein
MIKFQKNPVSGDPAYLDEERQIYYSRIVGGLVWPSENPGAVVAVGQADVWRPPRPVYVLSEFEENTIGDLIRRCSYLATEFHVEDFYGKPDQTCLRYIDQHNSEAKAKRMKRFNFQSAPSIDLPMDYHFNILRDRLTPGEKSIHFPEGSQLKGQLLAVPENQFISEDAHYPLVSALAYCVSALVESEGIGEGQRQTSYKTDYDELNYGNGNRRGTYKTDYNDLDY